MSRKKSRRRSRRPSTDKESPARGPRPRTARTPSTPRYVVVELRHDSRIAYTGSRFEAPDEVGHQVKRLNAVLEDYRIRSFGSHFGHSTSLIRQRVEAAPPSLGIPVSGAFAHSGFVQIVPRSPGDCARIAKRLNRLSSVWKAVVAPAPVPAGVPDGASVRRRNLEPTQGYLHSAPYGLGAMDVWSMDGARGEGVTVCDIEGGWNLSHDDLPRIKDLGGEPLDELSWRNHGTAVLGEMVAKPGVSGVVGMCHRAKAAVHSARIDGIFNTARAILLASAKLDAGDVILIELQAPGPRGRFVAMQFWDDVFSAIRVATAKGITVVEAAGNGDENFDRAEFRDTGLQKRAGAIVVGAGVPPSNAFDYHGRDDDKRFRYQHIGTPRSRAWFSNYGKIVDVQAWGWHVTTTGYGDALGGDDENAWYTHRFSGTSSASPMVTGAVACLQGRALALKGKPLTPKRVRQILMSTGSRQQAGPKTPVRQRIGAQPDLVKAMKKLR